MDNNFRNIIKNGKLNVIIYSLWGKKIEIIDLLGVLFFSKPIGRKPIALYMGNKMELSFFGVSYFANKG
jgi:hypothetical protein